MNRKNNFLPLVFSLLMLFVCGLLLSACGSSVNMSSVKSAEDIIELLNLRDMPIAKNIVMDNENPDCVICSDQIFMFLELMNEFKKLVYDNQGGKKRIRIFWTEECALPDLNIFDYAM